MIKRVLFSVPLVALIVGCSGGADSGTVGTSNDPWQVTSDRQNGGWEVVMLTSDQNAQDSFEKQHGFEYNGEGDPVLWIKKVDGFEQTEPEVWAVDDNGDRIPFNYMRFSDSGTTYLVTSLVAAPSDQRSLSKVQLDIGGETVAEWSLRSPKRSSSWPAVDGEGYEVTLTGVDLSLKPRRRHQAGGENSGSVFLHADDVEAVAGIDEAFEYELRYTVADEPEADFVSHFFNQPVVPDQGRGPRGGGGGGPRGGQRPTIDVSSYQADVFCRMMKYQREPFEFAWDASTVQFGSLDELENAAAPNLEIVTGHFDVYGMYWNTDYYGNGIESAWLRVKCIDENRREFSSELKQGWTSVFFEGSTVGRLMDQYDLPDGSTILVFEGSGMMRGWNGGDFSLSGHLRAIDAFEEKTVRMTLPVTKAAPEPAQGEEESTEE